MTKWWQMICWVMGKGTTGWASCIMCVCTWYYQKHYKCSKNMAHHDTNSPVEGRHLEQKVPLTCIAVHGSTCPTWVSMRTMDANDGWCQWQLLECKKLRMSLNNLINIQSKRVTISLIGWHQLLGICLRLLIHQDRKEREKRFVTAEDLMSSLRKRFNSMSLISLCCSLYARARRLRWHHVV